MKINLLKHKYYNLPNLLTALRLVFSIICAAYLLDQKITESIIFIILIILTELDGTFARKFKLDSRFGKIFDPAIDIAALAIIGLAFIIVKKLFNFYYLSILFLSLTVQILNIIFIIFKLEDYKKIRNITITIFLIPFSLFLSALLGWKFLENFLITLSFLAITPFIVFEFFLLRKAIK